VERLADGQKGFSRVAAIGKIESNHIRARNFKQRHAFLKLLTSMDHTSENDLLNNNNQTINRYQVNLPVNNIATANGSPCTTTTTTVSDDFKSID
jgi:lysozyme family protein